MRVRFLVPAVLLSSFAFVAGCDEDFEGHHGRYGDENEIVFGIQQRTVTVAQGETKEVAAGYDYLRLANRGGWGPAVFRDGDGEGTCYFESLEDRLGKPRVESGAAMFGGGKLPSPSGLQMLANQPDDSKFAGVGWEDGDLLTFDVTGFAMPRIPTITMNAPRTTLDVTAIAPAPAPSTTGAEEISIKVSDSVGVTWTPATEGPRSRVMVTLETDQANGPGSQVRCFASGDSGSAVIPAQWVARLFSTVDPAAPIKGHVAVSSHRQFTYYAQAAWVVYVVATTLHREHAFSGVR
jgi:hypothetical protein